MKQKIKFLWHMIIGSSVFYVDYDDGDESFLNTYNDCLYLIKYYPGTIKMKQ